MNCADVLAFFKEEKIYYPEADDVIKHILECRSPKCEEVKTSMLIFFESAMWTQRGERKLSRRVSDEAVVRVALAMSF